jgi:hypothetical protein
MQKDPSIDQFSKEKTIFDQKIENSRFATIASKKEYYDQIIKQVDQTNENMKSVYEKV